MVVKKFLKFCDKICQRNCGCNVVEPEEKLDPSFHKPSFRQITVEESDTSGKKLSLSVSNPDLIPSLQTEGIT